MSKNVIIIGAGGHGKVVADVVRCSGNRVLGFLDDSPQAPEQVAGIPVLGGVNTWQSYPDAEFLIAIGSAAARKRIAEAMPGVQWHTAIHPGAVVSGMEVTIGEGTVIAAGAVVNPGASIGRHCIINTGAIVEHDNILSDYVHISPAAALGGTVTVGESTHVGIGAVVKNNIRICPDCVIGAGAAVVRDLTESGVYVGVPAGRIR